jgi:hypothetical protein
MKISFLFRMFAGALWLAAAAPAGCGDDDAEAEADGGDTDTGTGSDTGEPEDPSIYCEELGLPIRPFDDSGTDSKTLYALATDFTVPTDGADFTLSARWSGCDSILVIQDKPRQNQSGFGYDIWERGEDVDRLFQRLPRNTVLLFVSYRTDENELQDSLAIIRGNVDDTLSEMDEAERTWWSRRVHYVTQPAGELPGWLGSIMLSPGWGVGIDRFQRVRYIGSYADPTRYNAGVGWFGPNLSMAAGEAIHYNAEAEREAALEAADALVVPVFGGDAAQDTVHADAELPGAAELEDFDTLEFDLTLGCVGNGEFGVCPDWDYLVYLYLCDEADPEVCDLELGRWITTYHREGRWVHDASALLPYLAGGGTRRFAFYTSQPYELTLSLRLSNTGKAARPAEAELLWHAAPTFDEVYNESFEPRTVFVPADAVRVELATVITGHGMSSPGNCAEFCNTDHHFFVNGIDNPQDFPMAGSTYGCQDQIADGTVPNQYGTWWYGRGGWCPGKHVPVVVTDVTDQVLPGADNLFEYEGYYLGMIYTNGSDWRHIDVTAWLVISR